ncbi:MAG: hypothetical protein ACO1RX_04700 [Candidatus Sericytochromatia bacterium]
MMSFVVLVVIVSGLIAALTSSMRLFSVQKQHALAQDIVRDVVSRYLKSEDYAAVNPFDDVDPALYYGVGNPPKVDLLYQVQSNGQETNHLAAYSLTYLKSDLRRLLYPILQIQMRPIKNDTGYYETKFNAVVRLSWASDGLQTPRMVEIPVVIGQADITRSERGSFDEPAALATPEPSANPSGAPSGAPSNNPSSTPIPSNSPSGTPSNSPSGTPSNSPSGTPTPSADPSGGPTPLPGLPSGSACGTPSVCRDTCASGDYVSVGSGKSKVNQCK